MNALYKNIHWDNIKHIVFDLDGTLYDEFCFVSQAYRKISHLFKHSEVIYSYMSKRWLEKGSSYPKIFEETYSLFSDDLLSNKHNKDWFVKESLALYRTTAPVLKLTKRTELILENLKTRFTLFLVTDGNINQQKAKFDALGLGDIFCEKNIFFTGVNSLLYAKPNPDSFYSFGIDSSRAVYFGDRSIDKEFASNTGMQFQLVYNMIPINIV